MKLEITRNSIRIIPESIQDIAYIEDTLGLKHEEDSIELKRVAPYNLPSSIAYLTTCKKINFNK